MIPRTIETRLPDKELQLGGTHIKIYGPVGVSQEELARREAEFIKQAAKCLLSARDTKKREG